ELRDLDADRVATGVGGDEAGVPAADAEPGEQRAPEPGGALQPGAGLGGGVQHQAVDQQRVDGGEPAGPVEQLLGEHVGVAGADDVDQPVPGDGVGDLGGGGADRRPLGGEQRVEQRGD